MCPPSSNINHLLLRPRPPASLQTSTSSCYHFGKTQSTLRAPSPTRAIAIAPLRCNHNQPGIAARPNAKPPKPLPSQRLNTTQRRLCALHTLADGDDDSSESVPAPCVGTIIIPSQNTNNTIKSKEYDPKETSMCVLSAITQSSSTQDTHTRRFELLQVPQPPVSTTTTSVSVSTNSKKRRLENTNEHNFANENAAANINITKEPESQQPQPVRRNKQCLKALAAKSTRSRRSGSGSGTTTEATATCRGSSRKKGRPPAAFKFWRKGQHFVSESSNMKMKVLLETIHAHAHAAGGSSKYDHDLLELGGRLDLVKQPKIMRPSDDEDAPQRVDVGVGAAFLSNKSSRNEASSSHILPQTFIFDVDADNAVTSSLNKADHTNTCKGESKSSPMHSNANDQAIASCETSVADCTSLFTGHARGSLGLVSSSGIQDSRGVAVAVAEADAAEDEEEPIQELEDHLEDIFENEEIQLLLVDGAGNFAERVRVSELSSSPSSANHQKVSPPQTTKRNTVFTNSTSTVNHAHPYPYLSLPPSTLPAKQSKLSPLRALQGAAQGMEKEQNNDSTQCGSFPKLFSRFDVRVVTSPVPSGNPLTSQRQSVMTITGIKKTPSPGIIDSPSPRSRTALLRPRSSSRQQHQRESVIAITRTSSTSRRRRGIDDDSPSTRYARLGLSNKLLHHNTCMPDDTKQTQNRVVIGISQPSALDMMNTPLVVAEAEGQEHRTPPELAVAEESDVGTSTGTEKESPMPTIDEAPTSKVNQ
jgi:hypothetical protein